jgi:acetyl-CoA acetyltransferase
MLHIDLTAIALMNSRPAPDRIPCIVGIGTTPFRALYRNPDPGRSDYDLALDAFYVALADSGMEKRDIDSVIVARLGSYLKFCADAGLEKVRYVNFQSAGGSQSGVALHQAAALIRAGQADVIACVYGNDGRSSGVVYGGGAIPTSRYDDPYGMTSNGAYYALLFRRHQHEYGTPVEALAEIAISNRANAALNANAIMQAPISRADYFAAPYIAEPLRRLDYCLVNDGGVAYLVTSLERARDLRHVPVRVLSSAVSGVMSYYYGADDCWFGALADLRGRLFPAAGLEPADLDVAQVYDNFSTSVVFAIEGIGICERGEAGSWLLAGNHRRGGSLPLNTAGGHLSESYQQGWANTVEAVRQLRGEGGARQVPDCRVALDVTCSPICSANLLGV